MMEQTIRTWKAAGQVRLLSVQQTYLLELAYAWAILGETDRAKHLIDEFMPIFQAPVYQHFLLMVLGILAFMRGDNQEAARYFWKSLWHADQAKHLLNSLLALERYAWSLQKGGQPARAAVLLGAAAEFRDRTGAKIFPRDLPLQENVVAEIRNSLGEAAYTAAWAEGQALGFDQAVADVLAQA